MKKFNLLIILIIFTTSLFSQEIKEIRTFHSNGNEKFVVYKNQELEVVRTETFGPNKLLIKSYSINPKTKKFEGEFFDLPNKGTFKDGKMTCYDCSIVLDYYGGNVMTYLTGNFVEGKPIGQIKVYQIVKGKKTRNDELTNFLYNLQVSSRIKYLIETGSIAYSLKHRLTLFYNDKGELDGKIKINELTDLFFENGVLEGFVIKNRENRSITRDSVFRKNKIWKAKNQFVKNTGWLVQLNWDEFINPWRFEYSYDGKDQEYSQYRNNSSEAVFFGSSISETGRISNIGFVTNYRKKFNPDTGLFSGYYSRSDKWWQLDESEDKNSNDRIKSDLKEAMSKLGFETGNNGDISLESKSYLSGSNFLSIKPDNDYAFIDLNTLINFINTNCLTNEFSPISKIFIREGESYVNFKNLKSINGFSSNKNEFDELIKSLKDKNEKFNKALESNDFSLMEKEYFSLLNFIEITVEQSEYYDGSEQGILDSSKESISNFQNKISTDLKIQEQISKSFVINSYLTSINGVEKLKDIKSIYLKGHITDKEFFDYKYMHPNLFYYRKYISLRGFADKDIFITKFDGDRGFIISKGNKKEFPEDLLQEMKKRAFIFAELDYLNNNKVVFDRVEKTDSGNFFVIRLNDNFETEVFYDIYSGLKVKEVKKGVSSSGTETITEIYYSNYKAVANEIKFPFTIVTKFSFNGRSSKNTQHYDEIEINSNKVTVEDFKE